MAIKTGVHTVTRSRNPGIRSSLLQANESKFLAERVAKHEAAKRLKQAKEEAKKRDPLFAAVRFDREVTKLLHREIAEARDLPLWKVQQICEYVNKPQVAPEPDDLSIMLANRKREEPKEE